MRPVSSSVVAGGLLLASMFLLSACQLLSSSTQSAPPPVAAFNGQAIHYDELRAAWERQQVEDAPADTTQALLTFLNQYLNYRLKVHEATQAGYEEQPSIRREIATYTRERARPLFMDAHVTGPVLDTLLARRTQEVHSRHILIRVDEEAAPEDTMQAHAQIQALRDSVINGADFAELARAESDDPSASRQGQRGFEGDLGYLSAGQLVGPYEDVMYQHPIDAPPTVVRTPFGYHLIDVLDRKPRLPRTRIAHLHIRPDDASPEAREAARAEIDSLAAALSPDSTAFAEAAIAHSDDARTAENGGELGWLSIDQYVPPAFRNAVRPLDSDGAISDVVALDHGFYLIQRREAEPLPSDSEAEATFRERLDDLPRTEARRNALYASLRDTIAVTVDSSAVEQALGISDWSRPVAGTPRNAPDTALAVVGPDTLRTPDFETYLQAHSDLRGSALNDALYEWVDQRRLDHAAVTWAQTHASLDDELTAFTDGLLVFELMQDSVWTDGASSPSLNDDPQATASPASSPSNDREQAYVERLRARYGADLFPQRLREQHAAYQP
ncbi:peptidylprolyl isomerase [Longimonas halophila]|nr:peptidylprolyl isomerase [Longimonas halophila]